MNEVLYGSAEVLEVCVPVATVWTSPDAPRDIDLPAVLDAPDVAGWTAAMDQVVRRGLTGRTLTQLLLGEPVHVLEHAGEWVRVAALWQPSSAHPSGYPGWVRRAHLAPPVPSTSGRAVVVSATAELTPVDGVPVPVSLGSSLALAPDGASATGGVVVLVPGPDGPVRATVSSTETTTDVPVPTAAAVLDTAGLFLGLRYLWGGTSDRGLDCSGLVHLTLRRHGIELPRDAFDQAAWAEPVDLDAVVPGDLYFFARPGEKVYHVGFVSARVDDAGVRRMLHAPEGGELIEEAPLAPHRVETLVSAGRVPGVDLGL